MGEFVEKTIVGKKIEKNVVEKIWKAVKAYKDSIRLHQSSSVRDELYQNIRRLTYETKIYGETLEDAFGPDFLDNFAKYNDAYEARIRVYRIIDALLYVNAPKERLYAVLEALGVEVIEDANV